LVENRDFLYPPAFCTPLCRGPCRNTAIPFGMEKLEWCGYPTVKKCLMIYLAISTEYRRVTDGQTDRQTYVLRPHSPSYPWLALAGDRGFVPSIQPRPRLPRTCQGDDAVCPLPAFNSCEYLFTSSDNAAEFDRPSVKSLQHIYQQICVLHININCVLQTAQFYHVSPCI